MSRRIDEVIIHCSATRRTWYADESLNAQVAKFDVGMSLKINGMISDITGSLVAAEKCWPDAPRVSSARTARAETRDRWVSV